MAHSRASLWAGTTSHLGRNLNPPPSPLRGLLKTAGGCVTPSLAEHDKRTPFATKRHSSLGAWGVHSTFGIPNRSPRADQGDALTIKDIFLMQPIFGSHGLALVSPHDFSVR